ncbi:leucine-rich repeat and IQ domain-containing protein 1 isoform X2 [Osmerus eperlanus]|uniref:leucine-rich repeat and IQ domain-containing protein 1 isoform X2 n=1 Tax=Osmerus eperlanus TaxID=29151 RepID=UPI002E0FBF4B
MDVNTFDEDITKQDQSKPNINDSDLEDITDEEEFYLSEEGADNDDDIIEIPESILSYVEVVRRRASALEHLILEDLENDDVSSIHASCSDDLLSQDAADFDGNVKLYEPDVISEEINKEMDTPPGGTNCPSESQVDWNIGNTDGVRSDEHLESERQFHLELKALERKMIEEDEMRTVELQAKREKQRNEEREQEEWKKRRQRDFEDELRRIEGTNEPLRIGMQTIDTETEEKRQKELLQQQELISSLQRQMEDERRALEAMLKEEKSRTEALRWGAAIKIQAGYRGLLARRGFRARLHCRREEERRREEDQRRREMEEERRRRREREEQELQRRRAEYERAKEVERLRLESEQKLEEEKRRKEEERSKREDEESRRREEDKIRKRDEEERRRREEEERRREEEQRRIRGEEERRKREEEEKKIREEEERRMEKEKIIEEENRKREDEKRKRQEEEKQRMEERRKKEAADKKRHKEEIRKKEQDDKRKEEERKIQPNLNHQTNKHQHTIRLIDDINLVESTSQKESTIHDSTPETADKGSPSHLYPNTTTIDPQQMTPDPVPASCNSGFMTLSEQTEQKRLAWMKDCIPWSKLSLQNKRKTQTPQRRRARRATAGDCLPPISPDVLLQHGAWGSLQEVTTVCVENLPGCSLSTLAHCPRLQSLTLRRCGLRALEGLGQCVELRYIDVQENVITSVDCENLVNLQVLHLSRNRLTSIHGLEGAVNLTVLELSYNLITRIGGLESLKKLQRLCIDHNQLISTSELRVVYTLLHLDCSSNHLSTVEGLDNCALLNTLNLRANNLTEPPLLKNQVLLRELHLEDNNISSMGGLTACWLPLLQLFSVAQNSITQLPLLSDFVSLEKLDLSHNCLSEVENVCESLKRCPFLLDVDLTGNPLQQEVDWRSSLLKAVPGLRDVDGHPPGSSPPPPTGVVLCSTLPEGSFLAFCQAQLQQVYTLEDAQRRELGEAVSPLSAVKVFSRHRDENLQLAEEHRYAHEYGDTTVDRRPSDKSDIQTVEIMDKAHESINRCISECFAGPGTKEPGRQELHKVSPLSPNKRNNQEVTPDKKVQLPRHRPSCSPRIGSSRTELSAALSYAKAQYPNATTSEEKPRAEPSKAPVPNPCNRDIKSMAAVVIQRHWRKHRRCRRIPLLHDEGGGGKRIGRRENGHGRGGGGRKFDAGITKNGQRCLDLGYAATVIQASWRGWSLRKRLASALAAARMDAEEDGSEEMHVDEFVFDETLLERDWTSLVLADSPPQSLPLPPQASHPKHHFPDPYPYQPRLPPDLQWKPKHAWLGAETPLEYTKRGVSHHSTSRKKSPASPSGLSGLSERSEKILEEWGFTDSHTALLMLKRAEKMKSKKQRRRKLLDSSVRLALFRNHSNQHVPIEAPEKHSPVKNDCFKPRGEELVEQEAGKVEQTRLKQERTYQWLHTQALDPDQLSESDHFLPQIDPDVLNGGRVQLVAAAGNRGGPDQASGLWANGASISPPPSKHSQGQNGSSVLSKKNVPSPNRAQSAPSKKERMSFRDNPVQRSGGWGGGKKRDRVQK